MSFKVGDRVRIITKEFEGNRCSPHFGTYGTVIEVLHWSNTNVKSQFKVSRESVPSDIQDIYYYVEHLELSGSYPMEPPDMELDEIHKAQELYNDLG